MKVSVLWAFYNVVKVKISLRFFTARVFFSTLDPSSCPRRVLMFDCKLPIGRIAMKKSDL